MLFDTPVYFLFLIAVVMLYWRLPWRQQNVALLVASYFFYGWWDYRFLLLIFASTFVDYQCGRMLARCDRPRTRRWLLALSLAVNISFLGFFKYFNFFVDSFAVALHTVGVDVGVPILRVVLPPGISFYTFQEIAYIVDVYRRRLPASKSFIDYGLFVSLFPHLVAGPIQQPAHLLPQVQNPRRLDWDQILGGLGLIATGLFRKCVIADNCAILANAAFDGRLGEPSAAVVAIGTYAFAWQIYGDFSGYSDIARGSAQLLGFHFMVNFRQPYLATTLQDFWRRWHISLSTWLRDYLFLPISYRLSARLDGVRWFGLRDDIWIYVGATMATMLLGGLWHGANWTFVAWGGLFGLLLSLERIFWTVVGGRGRNNPLRRTSYSLRSPRAWLMRIVAFHMVCVTWILFRSPSLSAAWRFARGMTTVTWRPLFGTAFGFLAVVAALTVVLDLVNEARREEYPFATGRLRFQLVSAWVLCAAVTLFAANDITAFIYFQF